MYNWSKCAPQTKLTCKQRVDLFWKLVLPSTSWKQSLGCPVGCNQNYLSWMFLQTGKMPGIYPVKKAKKANKKFISQVRKQNHKKV